MAAFSPSICKRTKQNKTQKRYRYRKKYIYFIYKRIRRNTQNRKLSVSVTRSYVIDDTPQLFSITDDFISALSSRAYSNSNPGCQCARARRLPFVCLHHYTRLLNDREAILSVQFFCFRHENTVTRIKAH